MKIAVFQHVEFEQPALITEWAAEHNHIVKIYHLYQHNCQLPEINDFDMLIVMGGPMSANDCSSVDWLASEKKFILTAIKANKFVFGICLGAQLIAAALGAKISRMPSREIGWHKIKIIPNSSNNNYVRCFTDGMKVFHWHGEKFDIPEGAQHLLASEACANQAFLYGKNVIGLQFHLEMDKANITDIIANCGNEIEPAKYIQTAHVIEADADSNIAICRNALFCLLNKVG